MEGIIMALIQLCVIVAIVYVVLYVIGQLGLAIPPQVVTIVWIIVGLVAVLFIFRHVLPGLGLRL